VIEVGDGGQRLLLWMMSEVVLYVNQGIGSHVLAEEDRDERERGG